MKLRFLWPAILWFIISFVLLTLPGSAFPEENWFSAIYFDKWVHIGMFGLQTLLLCWALFKSRAEKVFFGQFLFMALLSLAYGIAMEYVQRDFVVHRSFDVGDIIADGAGAAMGAAFTWYWLKVWLPGRRSGAKPKAD